jgi:hypothetical protein
MPLTEWTVVEDEASGVSTAYFDCLSFTGSSREAAVTAGLNSAFTALVRSSAVAAGHSSSDTTSKRSERTLLDKQENKRIKSSDDGDDVFEDAMTGDDAYDYDVDAFVAFLEETKEEVHRLTSSTNATAHPTNEATRIVTPTTEDSTEDAEKVNTMRTEECNAEDSDVNDSSKRSSSGYYQDLEGNWTSWTHCAEDEKGLTDAASNLPRPLYKTILDRVRTHQAGLHAVTP